MQSLPSFSAVVEWENARLSGAERATCMLRALFAQVAELSSRLERRPELIILYERDAVSTQLIETALRRAAESEIPLEVRLTGTNGSSYYNQKNEGAELASRDYLLFLDSDVIPEPGWLEALLGSLGRGIDVVAGSTYVDTKTFFGRAFGLFWFFPVRSNESGLREVKTFFANNVLFRRDLFLANKFPDLPLYRGQCSFVGIRLRRRGVRLFLQGDASVAHPPPSPRHFAHRALCEGFDVTARWILFAKPRNDGPGELGRQIGNLKERIKTRAEQIGAGRSDVIAAIVLGSAYCLLRVAGQKWADRSPEAAQRALGIRSSRPLQRIVPDVPAVARGPVPAAGKRRSAGASDLDGPLFLPASTSG